MYLDNFNIIYGYLIYIILFYTILSIILYKKTNINDDF